MSTFDTRRLMVIGMLLAMLAGCSSPTETAEQETPAPVTNDAQRTTAPLQQRTQTVMVPMPDGVSLATTIYLPRDGAGPWPAVLSRTPYGRSEFTGLGETLAEAGIVGVIQDQRGRHDSEGDDIGFFADTADGQATLDWIVTQVWSNGRVATDGGSAQGISQYLLAPGASEALACQWIEVATPDLYSAVYQGGAYRESLASGWLEEISSQHLISEYKARPLDEEYWDPADATRSYRDVHVAAFHVGGYFDIFASGIVEGFTGYQYEGGEGAAGHQHLVMGPWDHAVDNPAVGAAVFPGAVLEELHDEWQAIWYEACVYERMDIAEVDALPTVTYFTMGAIGEGEAPGNAWHSAETWPPAGSTETRLYLRDDNTLDTERPDEPSSGDTFSYNPGDPSPTVCGANMLIDAGSCDQRTVEERSDVVVYTSDALEAPFEVTGDLHAEIWMVTDVPDTDIVVRLTDVYPDGRSMLVADGILRARYNADPDFTSYEFLEPHTPYLLTVEMGPTSIVFNAGHQIRVSVTSSNWPRFSINPNTGDMFLEEGQNGRVATTTILRDAEHPSAVVVPAR